MWLSLLLAAAPLSTPPALPAPFQGLEGICADPGCDIRVYAPRGSHVKAGNSAAVGTTLGILEVAAGQRRCVAFDKGPNDDDPTLLIYPEGACGSAMPAGAAPDPELSLGGETFVLPGNGTLYSSSTAGRKFTLRQKWTRTLKGDWKPVPQPFYYVGKTVTVQRKNAQLDTQFPPAQLLSEPRTDAEVIANLAVGQTVEVLLAKTAHHTQWFLVRTPLGLVGWWPHLGTPGPPDRIDALDALGLWGAD